MLPSTRSGSEFAWTSESGIRRKVLSLSISERAALLGGPFLLPACDGWARVVSSLIGDLLSDVAGYITGQNIRVDGLQTQ
jgi:hypothetical protein